MTLDFADVKPSIVNFLIVGLLSSVFIILLKTVTQKWPVAGLSELAAAI